MTRRQFEALAKLVKGYADNGGAVGWHRLAVDLAALCAAENPRFDRNRFIDACSPEGFDDDCRRCLMGVRHTHDNGRDCEQQP